MRSWIQSVRNWFFKTVIDLFGNNSVAKNFRSWLTMTLGGMSPCTKKQTNIMRHQRRFFFTIFKGFINTTYDFGNIIGKIDMATPKKLISQYPNISVPLLPYQLNDWFQSIIPTVSDNGLRCIKIEDKSIEHLIQFFINVNQERRRSSCG